MTKKLCIAEARTANASKWKNRVVEWSEVVQLLTNTFRTHETVKEYFSFSKEKQSQIKDVGGFVGGKLKSGTALLRKKEVELKPPYGWRRVGFVEHRQIVALDADFGNIELWEDFQQLNIAGLFYTTHKHTPVNNRLRIVFPLDRECSPEEYECVGRIVASWLGMDYFDDTTYQATRLMYYPSTSIDGEFLSGVCDGEFLSVDDALAELEDWTDATTWPRSSREKEIRTKSAKTQNPEDKTGIIGAFCRAFPIDSAISEFLFDVYSPCPEMGPDRYTYAEGTTSGGLVVYDESTAYSHHSTDPACGSLCNSFDLVRIHKFGDMDEDSQQAITKRPSYRAMVDFASKLREVKVELLNEKRADLAGDYDELEEDARKVGEADEWITQLELEGNTSKVKATIANFVLILENDASLKDRLGFNQFEQREVTTKPFPWDSKKGKFPRPLTDSDDAQIRLYIERAYDLSAPTKLADAIMVVIHNNAFNPVRQYLDSLEWDGENRLDTLLIDCLGAKDCSYCRAVTRKFFAAAVARIYAPGTKFDYMLTLTGEQGLGKSSFLKKMGRGWFSDSLSTVTGNRAVESIQGSWIIEIAEMSSFRKAEVEQIKHFASKQEDRYRVAYGRRLEYFPRQCVFAPTTNLDEFLRDVTGNRRYWVVDCGKVKRASSWRDYLTEDVVAQVWAEAKEYYARGEKLFLDESMERVAQRIQDSHLEIDERRGLIDEYLMRKLPVNWESMEPYARREWLSDLDKVGTVERESVCVLEIWTECLGKMPEDITRRDSLEIGRVMKSFRSWLHSPAKRVKWYGVQKLWLHDNEL